MRSVQSGGHRSERIENAGPLTRWRVHALFATASLLVSCTAPNETSIAPVETEPTVSSEPTTTPSTTTPSTTTSTTNTSPDAVTTPTAVEQATTSVTETANEVVPSTTDDIVAETGPEPAEPLPAGPPSTIHDPVTVEGRLEQTMLNYFTSFVNCLGRLPNCDQSEVTADMDPSFAEGTIQNIERWNGLGALGRGTDTFLYEFIEVEAFADDARQASVLVCHSTEVEIYVPGSDDKTGLDSEDVLFGFPESRVQRFALFEVDGTWQIVAARKVEEGLGEGNTVCSDAATSLARP